MKIYSQQLPQILKSKLATCYLVSGDEIFLVQEACDLIRNAAIAQGITEFEYFAVEKGFAWKSLVTSLKNFSLFSSNKLIELRLLSSKIEALGAKILEEYLLNPSPDKILLLVAPKLETGWQKIKWIQILESKGVFLQIWPLEDKQLPGWISNRLRSKGLIANPAICELLAENTEGNLLSLAQEIDKLSLAFGSGNLDFDAVFAAITDNAHYNIFALVDTVLDKNFKKAIAILENLRMEGVESILILWALSKEFRLLYELSLGLLNGENFDKLCQSKKVFPKRIPLLRKALSQRSPLYFANLLQKAANLDRVLKGAEVGDVWQELLLLVKILGQSTTDTLTNTIKPR